MSITKRTFTMERVKIANGAAVSSGAVGTARNNGIIDATQYVGGKIRVPSAWTGADITFLIGTTMGSLGRSPVQAMPTDETFVKARDVTGAIHRITGIVTNEAAWYDIPAEVMAAGYFLIKSTNTASEADVNQSAERILYVSLKS